MQLTRLSLLKASADSGPQTTEPYSTIGRKNKKKRNSNIFDTRIKINIGI